MDVHLCHKPNNDVCPLFLGWSEREQYGLFPKNKKSCMGKRAENNSARGAMGKNILNNLKGEKISCLDLAHSLLHLLKKIMVCPGTVLYSNSPCKRVPWLAGLARFIPVLSHM